MSEYKKLEIKKSIVPDSKVEIFSPNKTYEDSQIASGPQSFDEYLGQENVKNKLKLYVQAAKMRNEALDHVLLFGPPGLGKTTLAKVIANELAVNLKITSAPAIERVGDLVSILSGLNKNEVLFIDEIHRLPKNIEESLYSAMESCFVDIILGQGTAAKTMQLPLNNFTLIGATTRTGALSGPLQTRFGIVERLEFYTDQELAEIAKQTAAKLSIVITDEACAEIGRRARGTPRIVKRLVRRVRDFAQIKMHPNISAEVANLALNFLNINQQGLDPLDQKVLKCISQDFGGGPVGIETLAAATGEDRQTLEEYCEPFLIRQGFLQKTPKGRKLAPNKSVIVKGESILVVQNEQQTLF